MRSKVFGIMLALGCVGTSVRGEKVVGTELINLPWSDLSNKTNLIDTSPLEYYTECVPLWMTTDWWEFEYGWNVFNQPSGLCMMALNCAFESCSPEDSIDVNHNPDLNMLWDFTNPRYNLPPKVFFPSVAGDVVAAIKFAHDHNIEVSVKNSGHHYAGGSQKKDTLHVNMNKYKRYTNAANEIVECHKNVGKYDMKPSSTNQACALASARNCPAFIRIGGGENWDKTYGAVDYFNNNTDGMKYHILGGGAGTVSPMGWTFLGGLASATLGRRYGLGADQVLQIEMVLPNGNHVRFGPTAWQKNTNQLYPKTTEVTGYCNKNYDSTNENEWKWTECEAAINFDDLWFATLGGGGGTWGIVLSIHYQLHNHHKVYYVEQPYKTMENSNTTHTEPEKNKIIQLAWEYAFDFLFDPTQLEDVTESDSNACGGISHEMYCYEEASRDKFFKGWMRYLEKHRPADEKVREYFESLEGYGKLPVIENYTWESYSKKEDVIESHGRQTFRYDVAGGKAPTYPSGFNLYNPVFTKQQIIDNKSHFAEYLVNNNQTIAYMAFPLTSGTQIPHDQANSVPRSYRDGVIMLFIPSKTYYDDTLFRNIALDDKTNDFPSIIGSNHAGPHHLGPLKNNWTSTCPRDRKWSQERREKSCISQQEVTYGSVVLKRLESIKERIDPTYMFDCNKCIGNNRQSTSTKKSKKKVKKSPKKKKN